VDPIRNRLTVATALLAVIFGVGTSGFYILFQGERSLLECAYFVTISLTTVGYAEVLPIHKSPSAMIFTMALMVSGMGVLLYFVSTLTAFIVEGQLQDILRSRRMERRISKLKQHIVLCGIGPMGRRVAREFRDTGERYVVIERDQAAVDRLALEFGKEVVHLLGDATDNEVLKAAGIERATALVACLTDDQDNLFVTISARSLNAGIRVISRAREETSVDKLKLAGADRVVQVNRIGGMRLANETLRPEVTDFLDHMRRDPKRTLRIEEVPIGEDSPFAGKSLSESDIRNATDVLVIAIVRLNGTYKYNPPPTYPIQAGETLVVIGDPRQVRKLRQPG